MLSPEQIAALAGPAVGPVRSVDPLPGDASTRRFFRLRLAGDASLVAMVFGEPIDPESHPQILVGRYFESLALPVPRLRAAIPEKGLLLYEDLGDLLLQDLFRSGEREREEIERLYLQAVELIVDLQDEGTRNLPAGHPAATAALDRERFLYELRFFREHYVEGLRGLSLGPREAKVLDGFLESLAGAASEPPWVLCHRDFHSRNLLVQCGRIRLVDFQDARMGPPAYDLASLLRDSYVVLPADLRERLFEAFLAKSRSLMADPGRFRAQFDVVSLQRNLKAIGTFAYQAGVRGKDVYLQYLEPTWMYVLDTLERLPRWSDAVPILELAAGG